MKFLIICCCSITLAAVDGFRSSILSKAVVQTYASSLLMIAESEKMKQQVGYKVSDFLAFTFGCLILLLIQAVDDYVKSGMFVGLGTGSTAFHAIERIGQKIRKGELVDMKCIPSSERTRQQVIKF